MELLGKMPRKAITGKFVRDYFNRHNELRHIKRLHFWGLESILVEKYEIPKEEVRSRLKPPVDGMKSELEKFVELKRIIRSRPPSA